MLPGKLAGARALPSFGLAAAAGAALAGCGGTDGWMAELASAVCPARAAGVPVGSGSARTFRGLARKKPRGCSLRSDFFTSLSSCSTSRSGIGSP
jgi:hypothetical protein